MHEAKSLCDEMSRSRRVEKLRQCGRRVHEEGVAAAPERGRSRVEERPERPRARAAPRGARGGSRRLGEERWVRQHDVRHTAERSRQALVEVRQVHAVGAALEVRRGEPGEPRVALDELHTRRGAEECVSQSERAHACAEVYDAPRLRTSLGGEASEQQRVDVHAVAPAGLEEGEAPPEEGVPGYIGRSC